MLVKAQKSPLLFSLFFFPFFYIVIKKKGKYKKGAQFLISCHFRTAQVRKLLKIPKHSSYIIML